MCVAEGGLVFPFAREGCENLQYGKQSPTNEIESATHQNQICIVRYESACRTEMNERLRGRSSVAEGVNVRHHIVSEPSLVRGGDFEVDVVEMDAHLRDCFVRNLNAELFFRLGECEPESSPESVAGTRRPELQHRPRCVSLCEG